MKHGLLVLLGFLVAPFPGEGQDQYVWLRLEGHRVITDARYQSVTAETLRVVRGGAVVELDLDDVVQIRFMQGSSMLQGAAIGAASGLATGAFVASSLNALGRNGTSISTTLAGFTVIGGIIGGTIAALESEGDIVRLDKLDKRSKAGRIRQAAQVAAMAER